MAQGVLKIIVCNSFMQCNSPGYVATQLVGLKKATWWAVDPVVYGRSSVATIGIQHHTNGCLYHVIQVTEMERVA